MMKKLLAFLLILLLVGQAGLCIASETRLPPMQKKNKNEVTDFFPKEVKDKVEIEQMMEESRINAANSIERKEVLTLLPDSDQIAEKSSELEGINQSEAEQKGLQIRAEDNEYWSRAHVNYKDPQVIRHKEDIDDIAKASEKLIARLFDKLKELEVDCKQKKGPTEIEPELYIEIEREKQKEVTYDKHLCEYLRNKYNCRDTLTLTCKVKGMRWNSWQDREIALDGKMLYHTYSDWGWSVKWKRKRHGWHISGSKGPESALTPEEINFQVRQFIANSLGVSIEQIYEIVGFPPGGRGIGNITPLYSRWRVVWDQYVFKYKYRDGYLDCFDWQERWDEKCILGAM